MPAFVVLLLALEQLMGRGYAKVQDFVGVFGVGAVKVAISIVILSMT